MRMFYFQYFLKQFYFFSCVTFLKVFMDIRASENTRATQLLIISKTLWCAGKCFSVVIVVSANVRGPRRTIKLNKKKDNFLLKYQTSVLFWHYGIYIFFHAGVNQFIRIMHACILTDEQHVFTTCVVFCTTRVYISAWTQNYVNFLWKPVL